jgi:hypothetical protein
MTATTKDWLQKKIKQIDNEKCAEVLTLCAKHVHDFALDILVQEILDLQDKSNKEKVCL